MEGKIELDYLKDLMYIFELRDNVERFVNSGEELGKKDNLKSDLPLLIGELKTLESKVRKLL